MKEKERQFYTYTLAKPDGTVFYVGKGSGNRIDAHERNARNGVESHTCHTIRKVWSEGGEVIKTKVAIFDDEQEAFAKEIELIAAYGRDNLTNLTDGGEGMAGLVIQRIKDINSPTIAALHAEVHKRLEYHPGYNDTPPPPLRYAVLPLREGYAIFDRMTHQIVDGVYDRADALDTAWSFSKYGEVPTDMTPTSETLGLLYPKQRFN